MRSRFPILFVVAALVGSAPAALAGTVAPVLTVDVGADSITVSGTADFQGDPPASGPRVKVMHDFELDGEILAEATPPYQDLVAGHIEESLLAIDFTWEVVDLPEAPLFVPEVSAYFWEFTLDPNPGDASDAPVPFSLRANIDARGRTSGSLQSNCSTTEGLVSCVPIPTAVVTVSYDGEADTVTASVRKRDLRNEDGFPIALEGAAIVEADLFEGIGAYTDFVVLTSGVMSDLGNMTEIPQYTLGRHVEAIVVEANTPEELLAEFFAPPQAVGTVDGAGAFSLEVPVFGAGSYKVAVRACTGGACSAPVVSDAVVVS